jgi:cytochrome oxidase Cu insertion factor (SCO1/SenC/PrrC family)
MKPVQKVLMSLLWALMVLIMVGVIGAGLWRKGQRDLPVLAEVPAFELTDQNSQPVTPKLLAGKPWVADFVFTHCAGPCPVMTRKMAELQKKMMSVQFVSFSVDPERDTPDVLKAYAATFGADESRWRFLTGSKDAIFATARGMLITAAPADADKPILHSEKFLLVDGEGKIRKYYDSKSPEALAALKEDAASLAEETVK